MRRARPSGFRLALAAALLAAPAGVAGQQGCQFIEGSGNLQNVDYGSGSVTYVGTPNLSCRDGVRIHADSAVAFQQSNYVQLIGHVRFDDPERRLTAQNAEYFTTVGRLQAHIGAVLVQKTDSTTVRGAEMIYNRADKDRTRAQLEVFGDRPRARLYVRAAPDSTGAQPDSTGAPYDIVADRILIEADSLFRGRGDVEITRNDLHAFADSLEYRQAAGTLRLLSRARMLLKGRDLTADLITAQMPGDEVREVIARQHALLVSTDIKLRAPLMHVFFDAGAMQRLVATPLTAAAAPPSSASPSSAAPGTAGKGGPPAAAVAPPPGEAAPGALPQAAALPPAAALPAPVPPAAATPAPLSEDDKARPVASSEDFTIVADSLDVLAPGQVLDRIHAVGRSRAESSARDSLNLPDTPKIARTDWMEGDTIVAQFTRVPVDTAARAAAPQPDTAQPRYRIERLTASGKARTLYRMEPSDSAKLRGDRHPAIHYVTAASIVLQWDKGEIRSMDVKGQTEGVHVEPAPRADSTRAVADSARARSDSTRTVAPPATRPRGGSAPPPATRPRGDQAVLPVRGRRWSRT